MTKLDKNLDKSTVGGRRYAWSQACSIWETIQIIGFKIYCDLIITGAVIAIITLILLVSFWCTLLVFLCVFFTIIGVTGVVTLLQWCIFYISWICSSWCVLHHMFYNFFRGFTPAVLFMGWYSSLFYYLL